MDDFCLKFWASIVAAARALCEARLLTDRKLFDGAPTAARRPRATSRREAHQTGLPLSMCPRGTRRRRRCRRRLHRRRRRHGRR